MEREGEESSSKPSQTAEEEQSQISEKKRVIMAVTRILGSGTLDEESLRLLERLADCIQCPQAKVTREAEPIKQAAAQQATPAEGEPVVTEPLEAPMGEPSSDDGPSASQRRRLSWDPCAPRQRSDGRARCCHARKDFTASRTAGFSIRWTRKTGSN